ncbi:MAG: response regulator transcription factor [Chloroflexota bacterium]|nr:response regulator transcription factor [Chloroflexota bacterium]
MRVLIVEDERRLADAVARGLRHRGMAVDIAYEGESALRKADLVDYAVVVLDRDLPGIHGDDVCRALRADESGPAILMLTASGELDQIVEGLALGADDYLAKPFAFEELLARLQALGRRPRRSVPPVLARGDVELDAARHVVRRGGKPVELRRKEFAVLRVLLEARGGVVSSEELLARVWDENVDPFTNVVRVVVMTLRRKLGDPPVVETVTGAGYRIR